MTALLNHVYVFFSWRDVLVPLLMKSLGNNGLPVVHPPEGTSIQRQMAVTAHLQTYGYCCLLQSGLQDKAVGNVLCPV